MSKARILFSVLLVFCLMASVLVLVGCGGGDGDEEENGGNGNGDTDTAAQWAAYAFGEEIDPASGDSGTLNTFTIEETYIDDGETREFEISGQYLGTENAQIKTTRMSMSDYSETTVTSTVECYKVKHRVTVKRDDSGDYQVGFWAEITVWIPTGEFEPAAMYLWMYPKMEYIDSNGISGMWSYYVTEAMENEVSTGAARYSHYTEGDIYDSDAWDLHGWVLQGLYYWGWFWFQAYAEGGAQHFEESTTLLGGYPVSCTSSAKTIGSYKFDAWTLTITVPGGIFTSTISPDLPIPVHLKVGASGGGSWEYTLTALTLA